MSSLAEFFVGQKVRKMSGDYSWVGEVRCVFTVCRDGPERVVVAHPVERGYVCHIYSPSQLVRIPPLIDEDET